jgi:LacI family transcriptional regulator
MAMDLTKSPLLSQRYFLEVLDGILESTMLRGWSATIFVENMWGDVGLAARRSYDGRCDGLIVVAPQTDNEVVRVMRDRGTPLVLIGTTASIEGVSSVDIDNRAAGANAARHLLELGHRRFVFFGFNDRVSAAIERESGFRQTVLEAGVPVEDYYVLAADRRARPEDVAKEFLAIPADRRPTAGLGWNDGLAIQMLELLPTMGVRVPEDFSIVGIDDSPESLISTPSLSSFRQVLPVLGRRAATLLMDRIEDHSLPDEVVRFQPEFMVRESTCPPPKEISEPIRHSHHATNGGYQ